MPSTTSKGRTEETRPGKGNQIGQSTSRTRRVARRRGSGADTSRAIRDKAIDLMAKHGFEGANLRMLAESIGIKPASLYNHIASKEQLLFDLIRTTMGDLADVTDRELATTDDPLEQIRRFVRLFLDYHVEHGKEGAVLYREMRNLSRANYRFIADLQREYMHRIGKIVERGVDAGQFRVRDPQVAALAVIQMISGIIQWYNPKGRLGPEKLREVYTGFALQLLGADAVALGGRGSQG